LDWITATSNELDLEKNTLRHPAVLYASCHRDAEWTADATIKKKHLHLHFSILSLFSPSFRQVCAVLSSKLATVKAQ